MFAPTWITCQPNGAGANVQIIDGAWYTIAEPPVPLYWYYVQSERVQESDLTSSGIVDFEFCVDSEEKKAFIRAAAVSESSGLWTKCQPEGVDANIELVDGAWYTINEPSVPLYWYYTQSDPVKEIGLTALGIVDFEYYVDHELEKAFIRATPVDDE